MGKQNAKGAGGAAPGGIAGRIVPLVEPITAQHGLLLWDVRFVKEGATWILRIVIDREDAPVSIDDCVAVSRQLSPVLDEKDPIPQSYCLEVTSPGADRELTRPEHFAYYIGYPVSVRLYAPDEAGRRELCGVLADWQDGVLTLEGEDGSRTVLEKKAVAAVHAIDDFEEIPEP